MPDDPNDVVEAAIRSAFVSYPKEDDPDWRSPHLSPVPAGSRIRGRISVAEAEDVPPDGLKVNYHMVIEIEGGQRPACVAELIALHYR